VVAEGKIVGVVWDGLRESYDAVANTYEERFHDELEHKERDRELLAAFADATGDPVAEIGCGPGHVGAFVRGLGRNVIGVDLSVNMIALARDRLDAGLVADLRQLPFGPGQIGGVLAFYSLIHVRREELRPALEECHRVLRPGGRLLLSAHEGQGQIEREEFLDEPVAFVATLFELDELVRATTTAGFDVTSALRRDPYPSEGQTGRLYLGAARADIA
jgi:SAM-dependent methyltransferase